jgi:hypothetical protein
MVRSAKTVLFFAENLFVLREKSCFSRKICSFCEERIEFRENNKGFASAGLFLAETTIKRCANWLK